MISIEIARELAELEHRRMNAWKHGRAPHPPAQRADAAEPGEAESGDFERELAELEHRRMNACRGAEATPFVQPDKRETARRRADSIALTVGGRERRIDIDGCELRAS